MRQALHILKKDLYSLRVFLLVFYLVVLVQTAITIRDPLLHDPLDSLSLVILLVPLSILVTTGMLIQQEPMVGTTAFWMTKPVNRGSLLLSKVLFLFVFLILPAALATLTVGLAYEIELTRMAPALVESSAAIVAMLIGAVLLAALTPNGSAFVVAGIGFLLANQLLNALIAQIGGYEGVTSSPIGGGVLLLGGLLLILYQYFRRRTRRTVIGLGVVWVVGTLTTHFVPGSFTQELDYRFTENDIQVTLNPGQTEIFFADPQLDGRVSITATPEVIKAPAGYDLTMSLLDGELRVDQETYGSLGSRGVALDSGAIEAAMPGFRRLGVRPREVFSFSAGAEERINFDKIFGKPATLRATVMGELYGYRLAGTLPLASGAHLDEGAVGVIVQGVLPRVHSVDVALRTRYILLRENQQPPSQLNRILLVNRRRREMLEIQSQERNSTATIQSLLGPPTIYASELKISFNSSPPQNEQVDQEWLRDAELAFFETVPAGRFRTQLDVSGFRLSDEPFTRRESGLRTAE